MKTTVTYLLFAVICNVGEAYRILGLFPLPCKSHMVMFENLMRGLAEKGHEVDVLSHFPQKTQIPRYNDISIRGSEPIYVNNLPFEVIHNNMNNYYDTITYMLEEAGIGPCKTVFNTTAAKELKNTKTKYDIVITEIFASDCMMGFAHHFKIPVVGITSSVNLPWGGDRIGNIDNPSYIPNYFVPYLSQMSLMERLFNTLILLGAKLGYMISTDSSTEIARKFFGPDLPHLQDLSYNTSLILVNSHFSINQARPTVPNFIEIGGLHIGSEKPLPKYFEDSLAITPKYKGVIYLSMGSMFLTESLPSSKLNALFQAFGELPYKVLWKATREKIPKHLDIPPNIQFESWMPQLDILCHPNVKLFITHGGLMGTQESVYCGVPLLGIPLFSDQELNVKASETIGLAIRVGFDNVTKESISGALKMLLEDTRYKTNAQKMSRLFRDRPLSVMDTAIYWIEYVIKHNGAPHLRSVGADLPWYQYLLVDVGVILFIVLFTSTLLIYYLLSYTIRTVFYGQKTQIKLKDN